MEFSLSSVMAMIVFGVSGLYIFRAGRRQANVNLVIIGIALMTYSYLTPNPWYDWAGGCLLLTGAYLLR